MLQNNLWKHLVGSSLYFDEPTNKIFLYTIWLELGTCLEIWRSATIDSYSLIVEYIFGFHFVEILYLRMLIVGERWCQDEESVVRKTSCFSLVENFPGIFLPSLFQRCFSFHHDREDDWVTLELHLLPAGLHKYYHTTEIQPRTCSMCRQNQSWY